MPDMRRAEIRTIRERTPKPFAVSVVVPQALLGEVEASEWMSLADIGEHGPARAQLDVGGGVDAYARRVEQVKVVLDEKPAVLVVTFDGPVDLVCDATNAPSRSWLCVAR